MRRATDHLVTALALILGNMENEERMSTPRGFKSRQQPFREIVPWGMVIMVEIDHKADEEVTSEAAEVEKWVTAVELMCNQVGRYLMLMRKPSVMLFR